MKRLHAKSYTYRVKRLCELFGVSKQAYYKHSDDCLAKTSHARFIVEYVQSIRQRYKAINGEKLWYMYQAYFTEKYSVGRDTFAKVLSQYGLTLQSLAIVAVPATLSTLCPCILI